MLFLGMYVVCVCVRMPACSSAHVAQPHVMQCVVHPFWLKHKAPAEESGDLR